MSQQIARVTPNDVVSEQVLLFVSSFGGGAVFGTVSTSFQMGVVVFFFLVFYVQHFVLARFTYFCQKTNI